MEAYISVYTTSGDYRRTLKKQRKDDVFPDIETMLIFILSYMKNNPLQQAHAAAFNMNQPQANLWIHLLKKILNTALGKADCIPCRAVDALNKLLVEGQDVLIDGTVLYFDLAILMFKKSFIVAKKTRLKILLLVT